MVVFATNVAETSLTIPDLRVVVDTGLAKEARYDPSRRITLLEEVMVSRSSADQRKGRAGRVAPGHCIRLYEEKDLVRTSIMPEILRSSLDKVVLQLVVLNYQPKSFDFITRPKDASLDASIDMLCEIKCLEESPGSGKKKPELTATPRGRVFVDLDFDPRLSNFVAMAEEEHQSGSVASVIAATMSAPGSVFFMAGKEGRKAAKKRIAELAMDHQSDLLLRYQAYRDWLSSGQQGRDGRAQRRAFAQENGLNNKVNRNRF
jgi:HrpA-like RNA helicase